MPLVLNGSGNISNGGIAGIQQDSRGYVNFPKQPYVILYPAGPTAPATLGSTDGSTMVRLGQNGSYLGVIDNSQGHWNATTAYFTCPIAGFYLVSISGIKYPQAGVLHVDLRLNGVAAFSGNARTRAEETATYCQYGSSYVIKCNAGDTLSWWAFGAAGWHEAHGTYSIFLLG